MDGTEEDPLRPGLETSGASLAAEKGLSDQD